MGRKVHNKWPDDIGYSIFIPSFADGNADGIGDFQGIIDKLDYLVDLGITLIWLSPIHPSPSYHKYDVKDYFKVHRDYGTKATFRKLIKRAHERGIKVLMDLVVNHTSVQHPWFKASKRSKDNPYRDYYIWKDYEEIKDEIEKKVLTDDSDNIFLWHQNGKKPEYYYGFFWKGMPDLNFDNPVVRQKMFEVGHYWITKFGVDGFRLDAAKHIYPDDQREKTIQFWSEFTASMQSVKSDVILLAEVWDNIDLVAPFAQSLPALFNFDLSIAIADSIHNADTEFIQHFIQSKSIYSQYNEAFIDVIFLSNHDQDRIASQLDNDEFKMKMAISILLTLKGTPFIYYGEELGMLGEKPDPQLREPFLWKPKSVDKFRSSNIKAKYSTDKTVDPLSVQKIDLHSLYLYYKVLIAFRKQYKTFFGMNAELNWIDENTSGLLNYELIYDEERLMIYHNLNSHSVYLPASYDSKPIWTNALLNDMDKNILPSYKSVIWLLEKINVDT